MKHCAKIVKIWQNWSALVKKLMKILHNSNNARCPRNSLRQDISPSNSLFPYLSVLCFLYIRNRCWLFPFRKVPMSTTSVWSASCPKECRQWWCIGANQSQDESRQSKNHQRRTKECSWTNWDILYPAAGQQHVSQMATVQEYPAAWWQCRMVCRWWWSSAGVIMLLLAKIMKITESKELTSSIYQSNKLVGLKGSSPWWHRGFESLLGTGVRILVGTGGSNPYWVPGVESLLGTGVRILVGTGGSNPYWASGEIFVGYRGFESFR